MSSKSPLGSRRLQQSVFGQRLFQLDHAGVFQRRHRQPQLARVAAEHLHRRLDRDRVGREAQHVAAEREQLAVPLLGFGEVALQHGADQREHVLGHDVADHRNHAPAADRHQRQRQAVVAAEDGEIRGADDLRRLIERAGRLLHHRDVLAARPAG